MSDEDAIVLASRQGFVTPEADGPKAPPTLKSLLGYLHAARILADALIDEVFAPGMAAIGVISIAGPRARLPTGTMQAMVPDLSIGDTGYGRHQQHVGIVLASALGKA